MTRACLPILIVTLLASPALAQDTVSLSVSASPASADEDVRGAEAGTFEAGLYWGVFLPSEEHELYEPDVTEVRFGQHPFEKVTPTLGLRGAFLPLQVLALEAEAGLFPTQTRDTSEGANVFALRGHAMLMAPTETIVPFLLVGGGILGVTSEPDVLGSDVDVAFHVGIGAKAYVTRDLALRLDVRDDITGGFADKKGVMHWEVLLGFVLVGGREEAPKPPPPPPDTDGDGVDDAHDRCKDVVGPVPDGCPPPPDTDGDGVSDVSDACPTTAGPANADVTKNGCPPAPDTDGDGVPDANDACPDLKGDAPNGCLADGDGDGLPDRDDKCATEPETKNGFDDQDGCPDELPKEVQAFTGVIQGIVFAASKATIRPESFAKLDEAVKVLTSYPALKLEVSGHTDTSGDAARNTTLSQERADAVKAYFVGKGVATERLTAVGKGSAEPIGDNATREGRGKNRRIEFKIVQ
jgi:outer membrane protein OmpA-like peptidoglycan-associated protein